MKTSESEVVKVFQDDVEFLVSKDGMLRGIFTLKNQEAREIIIPEMFEPGKYITSIGSNVCYREFEKIIIPNTVTTIMPQAFNEATVGEVVWSSSCKEIPEDCFRGSSITKISNIEDVEKVGVGAFKDSNIREMEWPKKCKHIPMLCFCGSELVKLSQTKDVEKIGRSAFRECCLKMFAWPPNCKTVPKYCFFASRLEEIWGIENVEKIEESAFGESSLYFFCWPKGCTAIPDRCFYNCSYLQEVTCIEDVEEIGDEAFYASHIEHFDWPKKCKEIPYKCFRTSWLTSISGIEGVEEIDEAAFANTSLTEIAWPDNCGIIPQDCFYNCVKLKKISNTKSVWSVERKAFRSTGFDETNKLDLSESAVSDIGVEAFELLRKEAVVLPYYISNDIAEKAFVDLNGEYSIPF